MPHLFVHNLTAIDASLLHPQRGLLGESWQVDVALQGSLDHQGMVLDFALVKQRVKASIDEHFDHRLLVPVTHPGCQIEPGERGVQLTFTTDDGEQVHHYAPPDAVALLETAEITAANLATAIIDRLRPQLPENVQAIDLQLRNEPIDGAHYRYSHGLKHHAGNCQRIAHGHRSRVKIYCNGARDRALEASWAERWHDIYLANQDDLRERFEYRSRPYYRFGYTAEQGRFELSLPADRCELISSESTVENLAAYIAGQLVKEHPGSTIRVEAYEGIGKGAVAEISG